MQHVRGHVTNDSVTDDILLKKIHRTTEEQFRFIFSHLITINNIYFVIKCWPFATQLPFFSIMKIYLIVAFAKTCSSFLV